MSVYIWVMLAISPLAFYCWYEWTYRWAIFDGGAGTFWRRLRTDFWISLPGLRGDIARITQVRAWVRKYARMESPNGHVLVTGVDKRFRDILKHQDYRTYEGVFLRPRWMLWCMMLGSLVWPIVLVGYIILFVLACAIAFFLACCEIFL